MISDDLLSYKKLYIKTAKDYILKIRKDLLKMRKKNFDNELLDDLYLDIHSLKGQSFAMQYKQIGKLCEELGLLITMIKELKIKINSEVLKLLDSCVQKLSDSILFLKTKNHELDLKDEFRAVHNYITEYKK